MLNKGKEAEKEVGVLSLKRVWFVRLSFMSEKNLYKWRKDLWDWWVVDVLTPFIRTEENSDQKEDGVEAYLALCRFISN